MSDTYKKVDNFQERTNKLNNINMTLEELKTFIKNSTEFDKEKLNAAITKIDIAKDNIKTAKSNIEDVYKALKTPKNPLPTEQSPYNNSM